jgi:hypothetical protein
MGALCWPHAIPASQPRLRPRNDRDLHLDNPQIITGGDLHSFDTSRPGQVLAAGRGRVACSPLATELQPTWGLSYVAW